LNYQPRQPRPLLACCSFGRQQVELIQDEIQG
jgi:hypothetical protein